MKSCYQVLRYCNGKEEPFGFTYTREWYADYIAYRTAAKNGRPLMLGTITSPRSAWAPNDILGVYYRVRAIHPTYPD